MKVCLFPGQGAQTKGMGQTLFQAFPEQTSIADSILGYSIAELCLQDPRNELNRTNYTQPALYVVETLGYLDYVQHQPQPDYLAGHSAGEYSALFAAGAFDFATGLKLIKKRGELMSTASGGGMLAVIGLEENSIRELLHANNLSSIDIANYNTPKQIVISGMLTDIQRANPILSTKAQACIPLNVSGAFHSRYMQKIADEFAAYLHGVKFAALKIPVIANISSEPYNSEPATIQQTLTLQLTNSVLWLNSIRYLKNLGITEFVEIGPGKLLSNMMKQIT